MILRLIDKQYEALKTLSLDSVTYKVIVAICMVRVCIRFIVLA